MKIIQSYWSKPTKSDDQLDEHGRSKGGWLNYKHNLMSWALSCLKLREFYNEVELITDLEGKRLLIDELNLPYTNYVEGLDILNHYDSKLWAVGKLYAYSVQQEPFIHIDGDIYIWKRFDSEFENKPLIVQNIEYDYPWYREILLEVNKYFNYIPNDVKSNLNFKNPILSICAGIIGGNNSSFFKEYTAEAFAFINRNKSNHRNINLGLFNVVFEQYLFFCMSKSRNINIEPYLHLEQYDKFSSIMNFNLAPFKYNYIHIAGSAKKDLFATEQLELRLFHEYPDYYYRILNIVGEKNSSVANEYNGRFKEIFKLLYSESYQNLINTDLVLNKNVKIIEKEHISYSYFNPISKKQVEVQFTDFDFMLLYFKKPNNLKKIINELVNSGVEINDSIIDKIIDYITDKLVYYRIIEIA